MAAICSERSPPTLTSMLSLALLGFSQDLPQEAPAKIPDIDPSADSQWPAAGHVRTEGLELRYRPELDPVLHDVTLDIAPGHKVGVVGRTVRNDIDWRMSLASSLLLGE